MYISSFPPPTLYSAVNSTVIQIKLCRTSPTIPKSMLPRNVITSVVLQHQPEKSARCSTVSPPL